MNLQGSWCWMVSKISPSRLEDWRPPKTLLSKHASKIQNSCWNGCRNVIQVLSKMDVHGKPCSANMVTAHLLHGLCRRNGQVVGAYHSAISTYFKAWSIALSAESPPVKELNPWLFGRKRILQGGVLKFSGNTEIPWLKWFSTTFPVKNGYGSNYTISLHQKRPIVRDISQPLTNAPESNPQAVKGLVP